MNEDFSGEKLRYRVNPCDISRFKVLALVGNSMAWLWEKFTWGTECPCCLFTRLVLALLLAGGIGAWLN